MSIVPAPRDRERRTDTKAAVGCDTCKYTTTVSCSYGNGKTSKGWDAAIGRVHVRLTKQGWSLVGNKLRCPTCEKARRAANKPEETMADPRVLKAVPTTDPALLPARSPDRTMKLAIITLLQEVFSAETGLYAGEETDKSVASTIGAGCMPGWVAELREEFYGPLKGNDSLEEVEERLEDARESLRLHGLKIGDLSAQIAQIGKEITQIGIGHAKIVQGLREAEKKLLALKSSFDPRVSK